MPSHTKKERSKKKSAGKKSVRKATSTRKSKPKGRR